MPRYDYYCTENERTIEVMHSMSIKLVNWGEVCALAKIDLDGLSAETLVSRVITKPPMANTPTGNVGLKNMGFTKLVKRDDGVYENVTQSGTEKRYMKAGDPSSMPHLSKKLSD
ncbi:MAG: hypothetical protein ACI9FB_001132 [Candidatus Azotimanducaceae bacterium]|jgi:hypothetical protein